MIGFPVSRRGVPIRLTAERWAHIVEEHAELRDLVSLVADTVAEPIAIVEGGAGEHLAYREIEPGKWLVVIYREQASDGFVITAFFTRRIRSLLRRRQLW